MTAPQPAGLPHPDLLEEVPTLGKATPAVRADAAPAVPALPPPEPPTDPLLPSGQVVAGRYTVLAPLGHGGMGLVMAAYDARLSRRVALKLLRPRWSLDDGDSQVRLLREAQAMARLSHPNVVHVYDSGRLEDESVFIAMEYVEGQTLREWLRQPRPWREVLRLFLEAGEGLAAAHAAGLVHRDFKPDNVLLGQDGRVRVTDFGVAQTVHEPGTAVPAQTHPLPRTWVEPITESGKLMGTPRYMAPEQLQGRPLDARSDVFAFCVALHEALYGVRPFAGETFSELLEAKLAERLTPPPARTEVPAWLGRAMVRGMRANPLQRPGSMRALLEELRNRPAQRRQAWALTAALAGGGALLLTAGAYGWRDLRAPQSTCTGMDRRLAGIWDARLREQLRQGLLGTGVPYAQDTFTRVSEALDAYSGEWVKQRSDACELARQEGAAQPQRVAALREFCLERRRSQLGALTQVLAHEPDAKAVSQAIQAVQTLPPLSTCADARVLTATVPPPEDMAVRAQAEALYPQVDRLGALHRAGKFKEGLELAARLRPQVMAVDHAPLQARTLYWSALLMDGAGDYTGSEATAREALVLSAQGKDASLEARTWSLLVTSIGERQGRYPEALVLELPLKAAAQRIGDELHLALALESLGNVRWRMGQHEQSREHYARALALLESAQSPRRLDLARLYDSQGRALMALGRTGDARKSFERSRALEQQLGISRGGPTP